MVHVHGVWFMRMCICMCMYNVHMRVQLANALGANGSKWIVVNGWATTVTSHDLP